MKYYILFWVMVWGAVSTATANERYLKWTGLTEVKAAGIRGLAASSTYEAKGIRYFWTTYDSTNPAYDADNPATWTEDLWVGEFGVHFTDDNAEYYIDKFRTHPIVKALGNQEEYRRSEFVSIP